MMKVGIITHTKSVIVPTTGDNSVSLRISENFQDDVLPRILMSCVWIDFEIHVPCTSGCHVF